MGSPGSRGNTTISTPRCPEMKDVAAATAADISSESNKSCGKIPVALDTGTSTKANPQGGMTESFDIPLALFPRDYSTEGLMGHLFCDANHQINEWVPVSRRRFLAAALSSPSRCSWKDDELSPNSGSSSTLYIAPNIFRARSVSACVASWIISDLQQHRRRWKRLLLLQCSNQSDTAPPAELVRVLSDLSIKSTAISLASSPVSLINVNEKGAGPNNFHGLTALSAGARRMEQLVPELHVTRRTSPRRIQFPKRRRLVLECS